MHNDVNPCKVDRGIICKYSFNIITLLDVWNILDIGDYIWSLFGNGDRSSKKIKLFDILAFEEASKNFRDVFWTPHVFGECDAPSTKSMLEYKNIVIDLDDKVCPDFWIKIDKLISTWNSGKSVMDIPCPDMGVFTGNGVHLYWHLCSSRFDKNVKLMIGVILNILRLRFCSYFGGEIDPVSIFHFFRVPDSSTKDGKRVIAFKFSNPWSGGDIFSFLSQFLDNEGYQILLDMVNGNIDYRDSVDLIMMKYSDLYNVSFGKKKLHNSSEKSIVLVDKNVKPFIPCDISDFRDDYLIKMFEWVEDDKNIVNKSFAKMVFFGLNFYAPINKGVRNLRLFGLSVALSKSGASLDTVAGMVEVTNEILCYPPLFKHEIKNCYINSNVYNMRSDTLRGYLGFKRWPYFRDKKSCGMNRRDAAINASEISNKRSLKLLFNYVLVYGFDSSIVSICECSKISTQTFYRYRRKGILYVMVMWMKDHNKFESICTFNRLLNDYKFDISDNDYSKYYNIFNSFLLE